MVRGSHKSCENRESHSQGELQATSQDRARKLKVRNQEVTVSHETESMGKRVRESRES